MDVQLQNYDYGLDQLILMKDFHKPGMYHNYSEYTGVWVGRAIFEAFLKAEVLGKYEIYETPTADGIGYRIITPEKAFIQITIVQSNPFQHARVLCIGLLSVVNALELWFNKTMGSTVEGVYKVTINEYFKDDQKRTASVTYNRNTNDFSDIYEYMYPRIDVPALVQSYLISNESLLLILGYPGTGKTSFVKKLLYEKAQQTKQHINATYVKDRDVLMEDSFWATLNEEEPEFLLLDDLDEELTPRIKGSKERSIVSKMLSFTNGIFPSKTKVVGTTNKPDDEMDDALIRPGRCHDVLELPRLSPEEALKIWTDNFKLTLPDFEECFKSLSEISQALLVSEYHRRRNSAPKSYLLDQSISVRNKYMKSERKRSLQINSRK